MDGVRWRVIECARPGELKKDDGNVAPHSGARVTESRWEIGGGGGGDNFEVFIFSAASLHHPCKSPLRCPCYQENRGKKKVARRPNCYYSRRETSPRSSSPPSFLFFSSIRATDDNRERRTRRGKQHFDFECGRNKRGAEFGGRSTS